MGKGALGGALPIFAEGGPPPFLVLQLGPFGEAGLAGARGRRGSAGKPEKKILRSSAPNGGLSGFALFAGNRGRGDGAPPGNVLRDFAN